MKKFTFFVLAYSIFQLPTSMCQAAIWQVGPTHTYIKPSQVSSLVQNGDTVDIDAGVYTADVAHWTANNLLLRGVGTGYAHLNANNTAYGQKGIWVIGGNNTTVRYIEFSHCHDVAGIDKNWAGIRQEGLNLTVSHCYFHNNDDGILAGTLNPSKIVIQFTEFDHNGPEFKSRANVNYILYNRFSNEATGDASREIDLPNGGPTVILGNIIEQGPNSSNSGIIGYGLEGITNPAPHELYLVNNSIVNDKTNGTFVAIQAGMDMYKAYNNIFAGSGTLLSGSATIIDTSKNWHVTNIANTGFVNAAGYDYHLTSGSQAINVGASAGTSNNGFSLTPGMEYAHPAGSVARVVLGIIDIGAHEFGSATGVNNNLDLQNEFQYWISEGNLIVATSVYDLTINIYDITGRILITEKVQEGISSIDLRKLSHGIYIIRSGSEQEAVSGKIFR
jgi:hypothetical protein